MKYPMPESVAISAADGKLYTATQMQEAFDAGRLAGLEAAAERVDGEDIQVPYYLADAIRNLKETP